MINALFWNIRGVSKAPNLRRLKKLIRLYSVQLVAICEPKLDVVSIESMRVRLSFDVVVVNLSEDIWVFIIYCLFVRLLEILLSIFRFGASSVDAPSLALLVCACQVHSGGAARLWQALLLEKPASQPWCICGDFNVTISPHEKKGAVLLASRRDWNSCSSFTWCNNRHGRARIWKRLDRLLVNADARLTGAFRLAGGSPMWVLSSKLIHTRRSIQEWNKHTFGNIFDASREAECAVCRAEARLETEGSDEAQVELNLAQAQMNHALSVEEQFLEAEGKGEMVTSRGWQLQILPCCLEAEAVQGVIHRIRNVHGAWVETDDEISNEANAHLESDPSFEEVRRIVFDMDGESAAGSDGFTGFFTFAWEVIGQDIYNAVLSFFCGVELPRFVTSTSIYLAPERPEPSGFLAVQTD
nr:uncharacterized protein LOC113722473 [Coffea arabica]